jgi:hypothetical protein
MLSFIRNMDRRMLLIVVIVAAAVLSILIRSSSTVTQTRVSGDYWTSVVASTDPHAADVMRLIGSSQPLPAGPVAILELGVDVSGSDAAGCTAGVIISHPSTWRVVAKDTSEFAVGDSSVVTNALKITAPDLVETNPAAGRALTGTLLTLPMPDGHLYRHMRLVFTVPDGSTREQLRVDQTVICDGATVGQVTGLNDGGEAVQS